MEAAKWKQPNGSSQMEAAKWKVILGPLGVL